MKSFCQEIEKYTYKWIEDVVCPGFEEKLLCYRRLSSRQIIGLYRRVVWMDQNEYRIWKIDFYDRKNDLLKTLVFSIISCI